MITTQTDLENFIKRAIVNTLIQQALDDGCEVKLYLEDEDVYIKIPNLSKYEKECGIENFHEDVITIDGDDVAILWDQKPLDIIDYYHKNLKSRIKKLQNTYTKWFQSTFVIPH